MRASRVLLLGLGLSLVACGDDDPGGTGGGGAAASSGASTGSTGSATSGSGGDAASTAGTGGAGGSGAGGSGDGGAGGGEATGGGSAACQGLTDDDPPVTVVTVDRDGTEVEVERLVWQGHPADPFWFEENVIEATCAGGGEAPCSRWAIAGDLPERIVVSSSYRDPEDDTAECTSWSSAFVQVHTHDASARQLVHLTLPTDGTYCIDPDTFETVLNHEHDEQVDEADCLAPPEEAEGRIVLHVVDEAGDPLPATIAHWYYHPESEEYDGEHPLACADLRCETWVVEDAPAPGTIFLSATYAGPLNPYVQTGWNGYEGISVDVQVDGTGEIVPVSATLTLVILESAIGG